MANVLTVSNNAQPLDVSRLNTRYVVNAHGKPVYLVGFHTWYNIQDGGTTNPPPTFDWSEYLSALQSYGCNATKLWASMEASRNWADPFTQGFNPQYFGVLRYNRSGTAGANDGGNKFDLTQINPAFLKRLYDRTAECSARGIYTVIQLFQGWQVEDKGGSQQPFDYHPYNSTNNINSVDGDFDNDGDGEETHMDANNAAWSYEQDLITAIVTRLNAFDGVIWEISNEDTGSTANTNWQEDVIAHIETTEASLPKQHPIMRTVCYPSGSNTDLDASAAVIVSYSDAYANAVTGGTKVSIYDSDHTFGLTATYSWIWQSLCNGHGGAYYMDEWDGELYGTDTRNNATYQLIRSNLGYALTISKRPGDLQLMTPQAALSATGYCLARNHATDADYIVFQDGTGAFNLNLSTATGTLNIYWLRCSSGETSTDTVAGGATRSLTPPWAGKVVAHVYH